MRFSQQSLASAADDSIAIDGETGRVARDSALLRNVAIHTEPRRLIRAGIAPADSANIRKTRLKAISEPAAISQHSSTVSINDAAAADAAAVPAIYQKAYLAGRQAAEVAFQAEHDAARKTGYQEGFEQGISEGRQKGEQQGREEGRTAARKDVEQENRAAQDLMRTAAEERFKHLDRFLSSLPAELSRCLESAEDDMVDLSHAVICRLLGEHLQTREGISHWIRQAVRDAVAGTAGNTELDIHVHPGDFRFLAADEMLADWLQRNQGPHVVSVNWIADERIRIGGCIVRTAGGCLDARIETRLKALRELLLQRPEVTDDVNSADAAIAANLRAER